MPYFSQSLPTVKDAWTENLKDNKIGKFIEEEKLNFPADKDGIKFKRNYHCLTRGLIINELVRRLHPEGKTMGEILRDDIRIEGIHLGMKDEDLKKKYPAKQMLHPYVLAQSLTPKWASSKKVDLDFLD